MLIFFIITERRLFGVAFSEMLPFRILFFLFAIRIWKAPRIWSTCDSKYIKNKIYTAERFAIALYDWVFFSEREFFPREPLSIFPSLPQHQVPKAQFLTNDFSKYNMILASNPTPSTRWTLEIVLVGKPIQLMLLLGKPIHLAILIFRGNDISNQVLVLENRMIAGMVLVGLICQ